LFSRSTRVLDPIRLQVWDHLGIALPQLRILFRVRATPGIDLRGLAADLRISPSAASQQVDKLVERGLLERSPDLRDRRRLQLFLTELGTAATRAISTAAIDYVMSLFDSVADDDLLQFKRLLQLLLDTAEQSPRPSPLHPEDAALEKLMIRR
jgi:DNA-binding MarR family transcriptional regulator